jgi:hypothetical protein
VPCHVMLCRAMACRRFEAEVERLKLKYREHTETGRSGLVCLQYYAADAHVQ